MNSLNTMMLLPILGSLLIAVIPTEQTLRIKQAALATTLLVAVTGVLTWFNFDSSNTAFQFVQSAEWIPSFGINYAFAKQNKIQPVISFYQNLGTGINDSSGLNTGYGDFANSLYFDVFYEVNKHLMINGNIGYQNRKKNFKNDFLGNIYFNYYKPDKYAVSIFMKIETAYLSGL